MPEPTAAKESGSLLIVVPLVLVAAVIISMAIFMLTSHRGTTKLPFVSPANNLPDISYFQTHKSDRFLVDMDVVASGVPYLGQQALSPHQGGHVNFAGDYKTWPRGGTAPSNYPSIYAVADGVITNVHNSTPVGNNDKYDISIELAKNIDFDYSIEPFIKEPSAGFYKNFILVKDGQKVKKGDVIAYVYFPNYDANGTHIHFDLHNVKTGQFMAPAIFTTEVVQDFYNHWGDFGYDGSGNSANRVKLPACMGYKLAAVENPFGTGAIDCLN